MARPPLPKEVSQAILELFYSNPSLTYPQIAEQAPTYIVRSTGKVRKVSPPSVIKILKVEGLWVPRKKALQ